MAAKWQQWMPLHIDRFMGSPSVRAMHPAAQMGYLYLLMVQWQSEDCTVSSDPFDLAEKSGLGDELWAVHGQRILRKFEAIESSGRLRNKICFEEWERARGTYQKRADAAEKTNTVRSPLRSPSGNGTVTVPETTDKRTGTVHGPVYVDVSVSVPVEGITPEMMAKGLAERLGISLGYGPGSFNTAVTEVADGELKAGRNLEDLCIEMEAAYRFFEQEKPTLRITWGPAKFFGDGHWRNPDGWPRKTKSRAKEISEWRAPDEED